MVEAGFDVVAQVGDADALLAAIREHSPDVAIVDIRMPPTHTDVEIVATLVAIAGAWTWAVLHIHRTRIVQRAIDILLAAWRAVRPVRPARPVRLSGHM